MKIHFGIVPRFNQIESLSLLKSSCIGILASILAVGSVVSSAKAAPEDVPKYDHIFEIIMENHAYDVIGNPDAPQINALAQNYGLATNYYALTHPSEPNYVGLIGGSYFGIQDDNSYKDNRVDAPSLADQLESKGLTWKSYQQSLPYIGYPGEVFPDENNKLYASKHNPFLNFAHVQDTPEEFEKIVPDTQLAEDLQSGQVPNFSLIVPDICHDMHGNKQDCPKSTTPGDDNDRSLVRNGDAYVGSIVDQITTSDIWSRGNNAIVITWDEDNKTDNNHIPTIVITNTGPRPIQDNTLYSHYSLLQTVQKAFGLGCLQNTCDTENVKSMTPLFALPTPATRTSKPSYVWKWHWF